MAREEQKQALPHGLTLLDRSRMTVSGVSDVLNFDENQVVLLTTQGRLVVRGTGLHVDQLSLESGDLKLSGTVDKMEYDENGTPGGLLRRLFS